MNLEGITIALLTEELSDLLLNGRIDKVAQPERLSLLLHIRSRQDTVYLYMTCAGSSPYICLLDKPPPNPDNPPAFCMLLRKHLEGGRITAIEQDNLDRVISFTVDTLGSGTGVISKTLLFELTGRNGNIIMARDGFIVDCLKHVGSGLNKFRQMLPGAPYLPPPPQDGLNPFRADAREIAREAAKSALNLPAAIVRATVGIGPFSAREAVWRAGLPLAMKAADMDQADLDSLTVALGELLSSLTAAPRPLVVTDQEDRLLAVTFYPPEHLGQVKLTEFTSLHSAIACARMLDTPRTPETMKIAGLIGNELTRAEKKLAALREEYSSAGQAERFKNIADNLFVHLPLLRKGMTNCSMTDLVSGELLAAELKAELTPAENAQRYYKLYNKAKRAVGQLEKQISETLALIDYLHSIQVSLDSSQAPEDMLEIKGELAALGLWRERLPKPSRNKPSLPWKIRLASGTLILVGKNNRQNDFLTFKTARPGDIWLHTKNIPGSHVILQTEAPDEDALSAAALLAAWFSKARGSSNIPVDFTPRKYVKKPAGSNPGFVIYEKQKTVQVTPEEDIINELLKNTVKSS